MTVVIRLFTDSLYLYVSMYMCVHQGALPELFIIARIYNLNVQ